MNGTDAMQAHLSRADAQPGDLHDSAVTQSRAAQLFAEERRAIQARVDEMLHRVLAAVDHH